MASDPHVLIIGAGTTGLLLAQGLKQANIPFTVFERETPNTYLNRSREWGMSLHWGNEAINQVLPPHLRARIREIWCDPHYEQPDPKDNYLPHFAGHTGEQLFAMPVGDCMRVSRSKMRKLFSDGLDVQYGKRLASVSKSNDNGVIASFDDGTQAAGTLLVGCDGSRSMARDYLVGKEAARPSQLELAMFNFTSKFEPELAKKIRQQDPIFFNSYHPKGRMLWISTQDIPDLAKPEDWLFQVIFSWATPPSKETFVHQAERTKFLKSMAEEYAEPWRSVIKQVPDDLQFGVDGVTVWSPVDWSDSPFAGLVTLAGDGAHPLSPYRGQGLNNALLDAANLTALLSSTEPSRWPEAVQKYEGEMRERALSEIPISSMTAMMVHDYDQVLQSPIAKMGIRRPKDEVVPKSGLAEVAAS